MGLLLDAEPELGAPHAGQWVAVGVSVTQKAWEPEGEVVGPIISSSLVRSPQGPALSQGERERQSGKGRKGGRKGLLALLGSLGARGARVALPRASASS